MSPQALQRTLVRSLYDPAWHARVCSAPAQELADIPLTDQERAWLLALDARALRADGLRRRRTLKALTDEYKVSSALAVARTRKLSALDAFFSGPHFHCCVQHRTAMAHAYAQHLGDLAAQHQDDRLRHVVALEDAMARVRRGRAPAQPSRWDLHAAYVCAPHVLPHALPGGVLESVHAVERILFEITLTPVVALAEDGPRLNDLPPLQEGQHRNVLLERSPHGEVTLSDASEGLCGLLLAAAMPLAGTQLLEVARHHGADPGEDAEVVSGVVRDGLLVASAT